MNDANSHTDQPRTPLALARWASSELKCLLDPSGWLAALTQKTRFLSSEQYGGTPQNRIYLGENLDAMIALLPEFSGRFDMIYLDPPFATGSTFSVKLPVWSETETRRLLEVPAYPDRLEGGLPAYIQMMAERLLLARELLSPTGSLFVHCDWRAQPYLRLLLDEIFPGGLRNEIAWCYTGPGSPRMGRFNRKHDTILWYARDPNRCRFFPDAIRQTHHPKTAVNFGKGLRGSGFIAKDYELKNGKIPEDWWQIPVAARFPIDGVYRTGYATEKPWRLLERIILSTTEPGSLVGDFFAGCGTTAAAAASLGRHFIVADREPLAVHLARKRLVSLGPQYDNSSNFSVYTNDDYSPGTMATRSHASRHGTRIELLAANTLPLPGGGPDRLAQFGEIGAIDFWAVGIRGPDGFSPAWQAVRSRDHPGLPLLSPELPYSQDSLTAIAFDVLGRRYEATLRESS